MEEAQICTVINDNIIGLMTPTYYCDSINVEESKAIVVQENT